MPLDNFKAGGVWISGGLPKIDPSRPESELNDDDGVVPFEELDDDMAVNNVLSGLSGVLGDTLCLTGSLIVIILF